MSALRFLPADDMAAWQQAVAAATGNGARDSSRLLDGAVFLLEQVEEPPAVWGDGSKVLWPEGEGLMVAAPQGAGKTTLLQQLSLHMIGVRDGALLGFTVRPTKRVLYLALDRPRQAQRSMRRMVTAEHEHALRERLIVWKGPLPFNPVREPFALANFVEAAEAEAVIIDSLKDYAANLTQDEVGSAVNRSVQEVLARGIELAVAHHQRKSSADNKKPNKLDDVYGSTWITSGMGSVLLLWSARAGARSVEAVHLKQPEEVVGPFEVLHDHATGTSSVRGAAERDVNVVSLLVEAEDRGLNLTQITGRLFGKQLAADLAYQARARRLLRNLVDEGTVEHVRGAAGGKGGGGRSGRWRMAVGA